MQKAYSFDGLHSGIPSNGVYFVFESGERGHGAQRIVRIGSHTGQGNLAVRLSEHVTPNKDRSIFRKNVGRALLARENDPFLASWNRDLTKRIDRDRYGATIDFEKQKTVEQVVSDYITKNMCVRVVSMVDPAIALRFERRCIATVSTCSFCSASSDWLGNWSPIKRIRDSGLWQFQHLFGNILTLDDINALHTQG